MRTTLDIIDILYQVVNPSSLRSAITGGLYKNTRPVNSNKEDIVINSLPVTGDQVQEGVANINIHVPNLVINTGSGQDKTQPNFLRMKSLSSAAAILLQEAWRDTGDVNFSIQNQTIFEEPELFEHYVNIRLRYFAVNV